MAAVRRAAVIGTGTMGPGMGAVLARAGIETALYDVSDGAAGEGEGGRRARRHSVLERLEAAQEDGGSLRFESDLAAALEGADFVLEAVPEKLELKHEVFPQFEEHVADDAILASNTSGIPITKIATVTEHPERVVGMHWSNPPHLIPMIEVIPGEQTSQDDGRRDVRARAPDRLPPGRRARGRRLRREPDPLRDPPRVPRPRRPRDHRPGGARPERALGDRLQARGDRPDGAARHGRPRHLQRRRLVPEPGSLHLGRGLADDPRPDRPGPARDEDGRRDLRLHARSRSTSCARSGQASSSPCGRRSRPER